MGSLHSVGSPSRSFSLMEDFYCCCTLIIQTDTTVYTATVLLLIYCCIYGRTDLMAFRSTEETVVYLLRSTHGARYIISGISGTYIFLDPVVILTLSFRMPPCAPSFYIVIGASARRVRGFSVIHDMSLFVRRGTSTGR